MTFDVSPLGLIAVLAVCVVVLTALLRGRGIKAEVGNVRVAVDEINKAVNCRPPHEPSISEEVRAIALKVDDLASAGHRTAAKVEEVGAKVGELAGDVSEIRHEQTAVARALGEHLAHTER